MRRIIGTLVVLAIVAVGAVLFIDGGETESKRLTATFPSTISLYEGARVKILGVTVGQVESIEVKGTAVEVVMTYDAEHDLPEDVHAIVVPPSVVGDRFVQLAPAYTDGPKLEDDAELGLDRTGVPLELDDTYRSLNQLASSLGPKGANRDGALSDLIRASARNLKGNGALFNQTIRDFASALETLASASGDFNGSTRNFAKITKTLAGKDKAIRSLVTNLAIISTELNGQRGDLTAAVKELRVALTAVGRFAKQNKGKLTEGIAGLTDVSTMLAAHTAELEEIAELSPVGLVSLMNTYAAGNWDPTKPYATGVDGRTGSQVLHNALTSDLDVQLGFLFSAVCATLQPDQRAQLEAFCSALEAAGGSLAEVVAGLAQGQAPTPGAQAGTGARGGR